MRTKALLCLAALAAGAVSTMAQNNVYSLNVVGYVNVPVEANKFYMLGNPLNVTAGNAVSNVIVLDDSWDSTLLYPWTASGYGAVETYFGGFGWSPGNTVIAPGSGFFLFPAKAGTITFVGEVVQTNTTVLPAGFTLTASAYPAALDLVTLGLTGQDSDIVYRFSPASGYGQPITFFEGYGWSDAANPNASTNGPTLNVAEGIFYSATKAFTWKQSFQIQ